MKRNTKINRDKNKNTDWKDLAQNFLGNFFSQIGENVSQKIKVWISEIKQKTFGTALMFIGFIFSLISFVYCINAIFDNQFLWLGYGVVGLTVLVMGYLINEKA